MKEDRAETPVAFDTYFYIGIGDADTETAKSVIRRLNEMKVRPVIDDTVLFELMKSNDPDKRSLIAARIGGFHLEPLNLSSFPSGFAVLRLRGEERDREMQKLRDLFDAADAAHLTAHGVGEINDKNNQTRKTKRMARKFHEEEVVPQLTELGWLDEDKNTDFDSMDPDAFDLDGMINAFLSTNPTAKQRSQFEMLASHVKSMQAITKPLFEGDGLEKYRALFDDAETVDPEAALDKILSLGVVSEEGVQQYLEHQAAINEILADVNRDYEKTPGYIGQRCFEEHLKRDQQSRAIGYLDTGKMPKKVGNSRRDYTRLGVFANHEDRIDLLHVDQTMLNDLESLSDGFTHDLGLTYRCFASMVDIKEVPALIKAKKEELFPQK